MSDKIKDPAGKFRRLITILGAIWGGFICYVFCHFMELPEFLQGWISAMGFFATWEYFQKIEESYK